MRSMRARLARLEQRLCREHDRPGWCCVVVDPEDPDALPPTCPHGGSWLVMEAVPPQSRGGSTDDADAQARSGACHRGTLVRSFTIRLDRPGSDFAEEDPDA